MTRVGTLAQSQALLSELMRTNENTFKSQLQVSTGKVAQEYRDIPSQTGVLLSAKRVEARTAQYQTAATQLNNQLDNQNVVLEQTASAASDLYQSILDGLSVESGATLMSQVDSAFRQTLSALNSQYNGSYIFAGSRTDTAPVNIATLADLQAAPTADAIFVNDQSRKSIEIDTGYQLDYNFLADEVGKDMMASLKRIADYNAGPNGPFGDPLTGAQRTFLTQEVASLKSVTQGLNSLVARNGQYSNEVDNAAARHEQTSVFVKSFIGDIEDVDMAQAITNLNQDQIATQATSKVLATLQQLSLLDFL